MAKVLVILFVLVSYMKSNCLAQTWVDSMDVYARESYMPANKYMWTWQRASLLRTMVVQYERRPASEKQIYLDYIRTAMFATEKRAHGKRPNAVASGHGMAFLYRITGEERFRTVAEKVYRDFKNILRIDSGGVSHKMTSPELWDDTIYMIGVFLLEMFKATGDAKYLDDFMEEFRIHRARLQNTKWGLWVHGWDGNSKNHCALCGQRNWPDPKTRQSAEIWGRGNGWVIVTLSEALRTIPNDHPYYDELAGYLLEMTEHLPSIQDETTGHWYQLPVKPHLDDNFIESSCTAMFAYGLLTVVQLNLSEDTSYQSSIELAYNGLREYSVIPLEGGYATTKNVCKGTCIGDEQYYLNRKSVTGKHFGLAMAILFGFEYERYIGTRMK